MPDSYEQEKNTPLIKERCRVQCLAPAYYAQN
nr:MAG TPA: hypothetical protein [Caudoviricetes sp.]